MSEGLSWEAIGVLSAIVGAIVVTVNGAFAWGLKASFNELGRRLDENLKDHKDFRGKIDRHGERLAVVETKLDIEAEPE